MRGWTRGRYLEGKPLPQRLRPPSGFGESSLRPPLPLGEGWGEGPQCKLPVWMRQGMGQRGLLGRPHPAFGHPLPKGEGLDLGRNQATPASDPLSLWERVGVRVSQCKLPVWMRQGMGQRGLLGRPHPAFGHPLPKGEGLDLGRNQATLSQRERGWIWDGTRPPSPKGRGVRFGTEPGHPLPKGRGVGFAGQAIRQQAVRMGSLHG